MEKYEGTLMINSQSPDRIEIVLTDGETNKQFLGIELSKEDLAKALNGVSDRPCAISVKGYDFKIEA